MNFWCRETLANLVNHWWFAKFHHPNFNNALWHIITKEANKQEFSKVSSIKNSLCSYSNTSQSCGNFQLASCLSVQARLSHLKTTQALMNIWQVSESSQGKNREWWTVGSFKTLQWLFYRFCYQTLMKVCFRFCAHKDNFDSAGHKRIMLKF